MRDSGGAPSGRFHRASSERHLFLATTVMLFGLLAGVLSLSMALAETPPADEHEDEPYIYERISSEVRFAADGTGTMITRARARLLNESGVQMLGQLLFPYTRSQESLSIDFARVIKPDGSVIEVGSDSIVDQAAPFTVYYPIYSDVRILHVLAPSLRPGDVLEYQSTGSIHSPPAPGQFFFQHEFEKDVVVLEEILILEIPADQEIRLRQDDEFTFEESETPDSRRLVWQTSNLDTEAPDPEVDLSELAMPDIEISSFADWAAVGNWYRTLAEGRAAPDEEIAEKARSLTEGIDGDLARIRSVYRFVATEFRYLGLELGIGAYQPTRATEVFSNRYGDCKDKHTLLQSLLQAVGYEARPVLVSALRDLSLDVPAPQQFDHLITAVDLPNGERLLLDSTIQVAPFQYLAPPIRGKTGLLVNPEGSAELVEVPDALPFDTFVDVEVDGVLDDEANLSGRVAIEYRGDEEFLLRTMLFSLPTAQWPQLARGAHSYLASFGEVADPRFSGATETDQPLTLSYSLEQDEHLDADDHEQKLRPLLPTLTPPKADTSEDDAEVEALQIDLPNLQTSRYSIQLSSRFEATAPEPTQLEGESGEYRSSYEVDGDRLTATRSLKLKQKEIEPEDFDRYQAFRDAIKEDHEVTFRLKLSEEALAEKVASGDVEALYARAEAAGDNKEWQEAIPLLQQVVELDPDHPYAWQDLGRALGNTGDFETGIEMIRKQLEVNPDNRYARNNLAWSLEETGDLEGAEAAFREQLESFPDNEYANNNLGKLLAEQDRCAEAIPVLRKSVAIDQGHNWNRYRLGHCLLMEGETDEGVEWLEVLIDATENPKLLLRAGSAAHKHEQYETAIGLFEQAIFLDPEDPDGYQFLGLALQKSGRPKEAIQVLEKYVELVPEDTEMRSYLASLMVRQGDYQRAEQYATSGGDVDSFSLSYLILSLHQSGKTEEAIEKAVNHLAQHPGDLEILDSLGRIQLSARQFDKAQETFETIVGIDPDFPEAHTWLARALFDGGHLDQARPHLETALEQDPLDSEANRMIAYYFARDGDLETAIDHLEQALVKSTIKAEIRLRIDLLKSQLDN